MVKYFRSEDLNYLYSIYKIHLDKLEIDINLENSTHGTYAHVEHYTAALQNNNDNNDINTKIIILQAIHALLNAGDELFATDFDNKLFGNAKFNRLTEILQEVGADPHD